MLRLVLAVLFRVGSIEVTYQGSRFRNYARETLEERFVGVPEQGRRNTISPDPLAPGQYIARRSTTRVGSASSAAPDPQTGYMSDGFQSDEACLIEHAGRARIEVAGHVRDHPPYAPDRAFLKASPCCRHQL
jgi:hypothetical protein